MRIVVAHESVGTEGGVETYLLSVIRALGDRGHQVALLYHRRSEAASPLRSSAQLAVGVEERGMNAALDELRRWGPDAAFSHNMGPLDVDRQLLARWPVVKMLHGYFGTCVSGLKMHAFPAAQVCGRTFGPTCLALYVPRRCGQLAPGAMVQGYRWASRQRELFSRYRAVVVASHHMRDEMARHGVPDDRLRVLPLFSTLFSTLASTVRSETVPSGGEPDTLLFAGRMTTLKGGHVLIAAVARAARELGRPVRIIMAGDGPQKEAWRSLASSLGVPLELMGWVGFEDRARVYARGQLVAVPSLWPEPFGLAGLDAASLGRPAVAFDVGGIREWLADGVNGRLVAPGDGEGGLARAIVAMLREPFERERMGQRALEVARRMSITAHVERLESVLGDVARA
jgi:glycosyltransferase involved in cell wall biosynthesis